MQIGICTRHVVFLQLSCASDTLESSRSGVSDDSGVGRSLATGGSNNAGAGGSLGTGGLLPSGCLDWLGGQGGTECGSPMVTVVDGDTGAVICDPSFTVTADAGVICYPTGNPREQLEEPDGAPTCSFLLGSLNGLEGQVEVQVVSPGYQPTLTSIKSCVRDATSKNRENVRRIADWRESFHG